MDIRVPAYMSCGNSEDRMVRGGGRGNVFCKESSKRKENGDENEGCVSVPSVEFGVRRPETDGGLREIGGIIRALNESSNEKNSPMEML